MKFIKRLLLAIFFLLFLLLGIAFIGPIIFKDQIVENVKKSINSTINAEVDFRDVNVSFLRSFPAINLRVDDYTVVGIDTFAGYPLATGQLAAIDLDFWSVWNGSESGNYEIEAIRLVEPDIRLLILNETLANYNIAKASEESSTEDGTSGEMLFQLQAFSVENGHFLYDDRSADTHLKINKLNTKGSGDFTLDVYDLTTTSTFEAFSLKQGDVTYLNRVEGALDAVIQVDMPNSIYTFKENKIRLNALDLTADGSIAMPAEDIVFDLQIGAPSTDFKQLWSMVPAAYTQGYEQVKAKGEFKLAAEIKGSYNGDKAQYPAFKMDVQVSDGSVQYPGKSVAIEAIQAALSVVSPSSNFDELSVNLPRFSMLLGGDPFSGRFQLSRPISDPTVDARINGKIDLSKWAQAMPMEDVQELSGLILADITLEKVRQSVLEAGNYAAVKMSGNATISNLVYASADYPRITLQQANANFNPQAVDIPSFDLQLGNSDLSGSASIKNILAYFSPQKTMRGRVSVRSNFFDADEWVDDTESQPLSPAELAAANEASALSDEALFNRFDFEVTASAQDIQYSSYRLKNSSLAGQFTPNQFNIQQIATTLGNTSLSGSGTVKNAWDYYFGDAILGGRLSFYTPFLDTGDFMEESSSAATAETEEALSAIPVPDDINLSIQLKADKVQYTDIALQDFQGELIIADEQIVIADGQTKLLGGYMQFAGAYDSSEPGEPGFRFHYNLQELGFGPAFQYLNSFKALMPLAELLEGKFNTDLIVEGKLGQDLYPILSSIDAKGFLQTLDASFTNTVQPLEKIGNALDIQELKERISFKELKSWFTIEKGRVTVEPFTLTLAGIPMQISGTHGLDMEMSYNIQAAVPRAKIQNNIVAGSAIKALDQLAGQASKLGLSIQPNDTLDVRIALGGSLQNPRTNIELMGLNKSSLQNTTNALVDAAEQKAREEAAKRVEAETGISAAKVEEAKTGVKQGIDSVRNAVGEQVQQAKDTLRSAANQAVEDAKKEAERRAREALGLGRDSTNTATTPTQGVKDAVEDIKKDLGKFNPFKKPKKDGN